MLYEKVTRRLGLYCLEFSGRSGETIKTCSLDVGKMFSQTVDSWGAVHSTDYPQWKHLNPKLKGKLYPGEIVTVQATSTGNEERTLHSKDGEALEFSTPDVLKAQSLCSF